MIKVGDYAKYKNDILIVKKTYMYSFVGISLTHATEHVLDYDNDVSWLVDYEDYEQQKQRADELESLLYTYRENSKSIPDLIEKIQASNKRADELEKSWSELVDVLKKKYEYYKVRADDESAGPIEQGKWKIAKHELMMVLKIMTDLKRGETE